MRAMGRTRSVTSIDSPRSTARRCSENTFSLRRKLGRQLRVVRTGTPQFAPSLDRCSAA